MTAAVLRELNTDLVPTPCFVVDTEALRENLQILDNVQNAAECTILLALKGFAAWHFAPLVRQYLKGVAASSPHEARLGHDEFAGQVHTYSPAYSPRHFHEVIQYSDHIIFNSFSEWQRYKPQVQGEHISCGIRINHEHSEVTTAIYDPSAPKSRLGVTLEEFREDQLDGITGLHFHSLCELGADALVRTLRVVEDKFGKYFPKLRWINLGGGHHITAPDYDRQLLVDTIIEFRQRHPNLEVILEPGEAIAIRTGVLVASVLDILKNGDTQLAILDISATAHIPDVLEMPYRPDIVDASAEGVRAHSYRLGGMSCLAGDVIGDYSFDTPLVPGQKLIFTDMSHYTMVKTSNFNGVQLPSIASFNPTDGECTVIREFGYDSYRNRLS